MDPLSNRLKLQTKLEEILGSEHVYFQPPPSIKMEYPCIVYEFAEYDVRHANNKIYMGKDRYKLTFITRKVGPLEGLLDLPYCSFDRPYISNNLYHYVYNLYY